MSVSFNKNGIVMTSGIEVGENLIEKSMNFSGWSINSIFTIDQISIGEYVASATRTGATSNMWSRIIPTVKLNPELYPNGVTASFDFKCNDINALDHKCICALQIYNSNNTRIGWYEAKNSFSEANYVGSTTLKNGVWKRLSCYFTQSNLKTISSSGYTVNDISYTMLSFQLVKNGSISFKNIKLELGSTPTPWIPNVNDYGVVPTSHGFAEQNTFMSVYKDYITTSEFIEY